MAKESSAALEAQIVKARQAVYSDGYPMSIGELTNLYKEGELIIRPEFQRLYRWSDVQKSNLVESLVLGIPIPSIFVAQTDDGKWELVDGLQRVSTILEVQGELIDQYGNKLPALTLVKTKYLSALEGCVWDAPNAENSLSEAHRLDFKRSKIDVKIIKRASSVDAKYDLFQRLNNYGSRLSAQEMRSALLVAVSSDFFTWLEAWAQYPPFTRCIQVPERLLEERYDLELVLRFLTLHNRDQNKLTASTLRDLPQVLDDSSVELAKGFPENSERLSASFKETFDVIDANGGFDVFRRWDSQRAEFRGAFLNTSYEVFALGIGYHVANSNEYRKDLMPLVKEFWQLEQMKSGFATGRSTEARLAQFVPLGRQLLSVRAVA